MKDEKPIVFEKDGIKYSYHFAINKYDGDKVVKWEDCIWEPKNKYVS